MWTELDCIMVHWWVLWVAEELLIVISSYGHFVTCQMLILSLNLLEYLYFIASELDAIIYLKGFDGLRKWIACHYFLSFG